jgi:hypothetical protein
VTPSCLFDEFNARYWHGRLPRYQVLRGHHDGGLGWCVDATRTIMLDHTLTGEALELVLLHEMAHIGSAAAAHGPQFKQEVRRLVRLGAPARLLDDLERYNSREPDPGRVVHPSPRERT